MADERRITSEMAAQARAEIERVLASGQARSALNLLGTELQFEKDPAGQISFGTPDGSVLSRLIPAADYRPASYPQALPFISGESVIVTQTDPASWSLAWMAPADPNGVFDSIIEQCEAQGWSLGDSQALPHIPAMHRKLYRGTWTCEVMLSGAIVSLFADLE
jgi:hypothetical protein